MRKFIQLAEALSTVQPYKWDDTPAAPHLKRRVTATFEVAGKRVHVDFFIDDTHADIVFSVNSSEDITGEGDAFTIFGTVIDIIQDFSHSNPEIETMYFDAAAAESSRVKLYRALVAKLAKSWRVSERSIDLGRKLQFVLRK